MLLIYGAYDENATRTKIIHIEKNPEQNQSFRWMFLRLCQSLRGIGNLNVTSSSSNLKYCNINKLKLVINLPQAYLSYYIHLRLNFQLLIFCFLKYLIIY